MQCVATQCSEMGVATTVKLFKTIIMIDLVNFQKYTIYKYVAVTGRK